jgi:hypothetical protein
VPASVPHPPPQRTTLWPLPFLLTNTRGEARACNPHAFPCTLHWYNSTSMIQQLVTIRCFGPMMGATPLRLNRHLERPPILYPITAHGQLALVHLFHCSMLMRRLSAGWRSLAQQMSSAIVCYISISTYFFLALFWGCATLHNVALPARSEIPKVQWFFLEKLWQVPQVRKLSNSY